MKNELLKRIRANEEKLPTMDGFDDCIVGVVTQFNNTFVVYDRGKVVAKLMKRDKMDYDEAQEFHSFNQAGAWVGPNTPAFVEFGCGVKDE